MLTLAGLIGGYILALIVGKHVLRMKVSTYFLIALITLVQVAVVLYELYTKEYPKL
ncbi:MAG: hypothetical protein KGJ59_02680 [Bacteroidota bacterium]|nr:hypothetical protein [Bacteroidota bacterium]